jgi:hypothetical protein
MIGEIKLAAASPKIGGSDSLKRYQDISKSIGANCTKCDNDLAAAWRRFLDNGTAVLIYVMSLP